MHSSSKAASAGTAACADMVVQWVGSAFKVVCVLLSHKPFPSTNCFPAETMAHRGVEGAFGDLAERRQKVRVGRREEGGGGATRQGSGALLQEVLRWKAAGGNSEIATPTGLRW